MFIGRFILLTSLLSLSTINSTFGEELLCVGADIQKDNQLEKFSEECCKVAKKTVAGEDLLNSKPFNKEFDLVLNQRVKEINDQIEYLELDSNNSNGEYSKSIERLRKYKNKLISQKEVMRREIAAGCAGTKGRRFGINIGMSKDLVNQYKNISYFDRAPDTTVNNIYASLKNEYLPLDFKNAPEEKLQGFLNQAAKTSLASRIEQYKEAVSKTIAKMGTFASSEEAQSVVDQIESRADFGMCAINENVVDKKAIVPIAPVEVSSFFGAKKFFDDNSAKLSSKARSQLTNSLGDSKMNSTPMTVKIYTCSSMYKNCSQSNEGECLGLSMMRKYTDESLIKSSKTPQALKDVLKDKDYIKRKNEMEESDLYQDPKEQRLWLALSMMRAQSVKNEIQSQLGEKSKIKFELIPTGHPDDPFNNSKVDKALSGTCGPLPKTGTDSYYGNDDDKCEAKSFLIEKMERRDKAFRLSGKYDSLYSTLAKDEAPSTLHRYVKVEFVVSGAKTQPSENQVEEKTNSYSVICARLSNSCEQWKKDFRLPHFSLPLIRMGSGRGNWGGTGCYFK